MLKLYENIKKFRKATNMSQRELAERLGYSDRSTISRIEKGEIDLSQSKIRQIANIFGITVGELMGYTDNPFNPAQAFNKNLRYYMKSRNISNAEIACVTGAELWEVQQWIDGDNERGDCFPSNEELSKLANYLKVDATALVENILYLNVKPAYHAELSEKRQQLIDFAMTVPEDKLALILRLAKSVLEDE